MPAATTTDSVPALYGAAWLIATAAGLLLWPGLSRNLLRSNDFMPHGGCYLWLPPLVRLHVVADLLIGVSYVAISSLLALLVYKARRDIPFQSMFLAFGLFIVSCGATHFMEVWTVWRPYYWLAGGVKLFTAGVSLAAAVGLPSLIPKVLAMIASARLSEERRQRLETANAALAQAAQELACKNAQLLAANKEAETFNYSVAHDLRAPLRAMDGFANLLVDRHGGALDVEGRELLGRISANANRMSRLIDDLLSFSRLGRHELLPAELDMDALCRSACGETAAGDAARLTIGDLPRARGDQTLIHQVLLNLVANAVKFSAKNESPRVDIRGWVDGSECVYAVRDNGVGFDMGHVGTLFRVFQRLHALAEFDGSGIGLANVHRIVTRHGGRVWAEGKVGEGATFFFTLPRSP